MSEDLDDYTDRLFSYEVTKTQEVEEGVAATAGFKVSSPDQFLSRGS